MYQANLSGLVRVVTLVSTAVCLSGLSAAVAGSQESSKTSSSSGYHTPPRTPRGARKPAPKPKQSGEESSLLNKSLTEIRSGNLSAAVHALTQLVGLNPKEPRYRELLERTRSQLEFENWYRFSQRNDPEDLPEVAEAMGEAGKSPAEAREQFLIWVNSIHWDRR